MPDTTSERPVASCDHLESTDRVEGPRAEASAGTLLPLDCFCACEAPERAERCDGPRAKASAGGAAAPVAAECTERGGEGERRARSSEAVGLRPPALRFRSEPRRPESREGLRLGKLSNEAKRPIFVFVVRSEASSSKDTRELRPPWPNESRPTTSKSCVAWALPLTLTNASSRVSTQAPEAMSCLTVSPEQMMLASQCLHRHIRRLAKLMASPMLPNFIFLSLPRLPARTWPV
mmetsp:Transcript_157921/g.506505  ORF Transcript_157921/g.506505 Transcript_157921/m.506505 type:complete len:234 (-) Transcript_157921:2544-3245(-)